jgi:DNA polymerase-3 subunit gamma/tau
MSYEVLARKYRPANFEEVVGQEHIVQAISNSISQDRIHQSYIFAGTRGVGKTTLARILAKCLNCKSSEKPIPEPCDKCTNCHEIKIGRHLDFLEIDAASKTGIDDMRDLLETVPHSPSQGRFKVYLIDEVHMLSTSSFNALLKTLEEPPPHVIFIFATTNPEKIPKTVQSRCLQLNLKTVGVNALSDHLKKIIELEKIKYDVESLDLISDSAEGSVRDALTLLDQAIAHGNGELDASNVKKLLGTIDNSLLIALLNSVIDGNGEVSFEHLYKIEELSPEYEAILKSIISILHLVSLEQVLGNTTDENIKALSRKMDQEFCQLLYEIAVNAYSKFSVHPHAKEALEICLLRMLAFNPLHKIDENSPSQSSTEKKNLKVEISSIQKLGKVKPESLIAEKIKIQNVQNKESCIDPKLTSSVFDSPDKWIEFFNGLDLSPFARNYFGSLSFKDYSNNLLVLNTEDDQNKIHKQSIRISNQ